MSETHSTRMVHVDGLKGAIIIIVVFIHIVALSSMNRTSDGGETNLFLQAVYLGLMAFFIISGYFYRPQNSFSENIGKRLAQMLMGMVACCLILPLIIYGWETLFGQCPGLDDLINAYVQGFFCENVFQDFTVTAAKAHSSAFTGYYFLWVMLIAFVVFYLVAPRVYGDIRKVAAAIILFVVIQFAYTEFVHLRLPFGLHLVPIAVAFMLAGMGITRWRVLERMGEVSLKSKDFWLPFVASLAGCIVMVYFFHPGVSFDNGFFGYYGGYSVFPFFVSAMLLFVVVSNLLVLLMKIPVFRIPFVEMGKHTLGTMLLHTFFARMLVIPFATITDATMPPIGVPALVVVALITLVLCYVTCRFGPDVVVKIKERAGGRSSAA